MSINNNLELYIHIPFCERKCNYCDFLSAPADEETRELYVNALINEIRACRDTYAGFNITTIFIGGGTPSALSADQMGRIVAALSDVFDLSGLKGKPKTIFRKKAIPPKIEFTIECNPGTIDRDKLKAYKKMGINRLSIGAQSTVDAELKELGRIHSANDFLDSFNEARMAGFDNINVDLMQAIPLQTIGSWRKTLMSVAALRPEHISAYSLIIEEGTPFYDRMHSQFPLALPDEDTEREIYYSTKELLEQFGYERYEISNYALPGKQCRHNIGYWSRENYLGLGLGASSMVDNIRWKNISDLNSYNEQLHGLYDDNPYADGTAVLGSIRCEEEKVSYKDQMAEYMFLGLRMSRGVSKEEFIAQFRTAYDYVYGDATEHLIDLGLLQVTEKEYEDELTGRMLTDTRVSLTDKGVDVSNRVFAEFMPDTTDDDLL